MNDQELREYCDRLGYGDAAFELIQTIRHNPPARVPQTGTRNRTGRIASHKMGATRSHESGTVERAWLLMHEGDPQTLEYWEQPAVPVTISYEDTTGRRITYTSIADAFVMTSRGVWYEEYKTERWLAEAVAKKPGAYVLEDGRWRCPPAEKFAAQYGLGFVVRTDAEVPRRRLRNIEFLSDYFAEERSVIDPALIDRLVLFLRRNPGATPAEILADPELGVDADSLYRLIAAGDIFVDLDSEALGEPYRAKVFADALTAEAWQTRAAPPAMVGLEATHIVLEPGSEVNWDGRAYTRVNKGETGLALQGDDGQIVTISAAQLDRLLAAGQLRGLRVARSEGDVDARAREVLALATPDDLAEASRRFRVINNFRGGAGLPSDVSQATVYRWMASFDEAEIVYGRGYVGLLPSGRLGNRTARLDPRVVALMEEAYRKQYAVVRQPKAKAAHKELRKMCAAAGLKSPSYRSWTRWLAKKDRAAKIRAREGQKAAYQVDIPWLLTSDTPVHGDRPFQIAHLDHTLLDIELVCVRTMKNLGRPWLSLLMDAWSRRVLAFWLTFEPPSHRSAMASVRACVRRNSRLPQILVVDGGKEFRSVYFESLSALYGMSIEHRPAGGARHGSVLERLFGVTNTELIHTLEGNTQATKKVRQLTKAIDPQRHATWDLEALHEALEQWFFEDYDAREHSALGRSPRNAFVDGLRLGGDRPSTLIPFDETFQMASLPTTTKGTVRTDGTRGVKVGKIRYWAPELNRAEVVGRDLPVRIDPWDIRHVYVYIRSLGWVEAHARGLWNFDAVTVRELAIASEERRQSGRTIASENDVVVALESNSSRRELERLKAEAGRRVIDIVEGRPVETLRPPVDVLDGDRPEMLPASRAPAKRRVSEEASRLFGLEVARDALYEPGDEFGSYN